MNSYFTVVHIVFKTTKLYGFSQATPCSSFRYFYCSCHVHRM